MKQKVMRAWVRALRSGKYKQGRGALRNKTAAFKTGQKFCCLGVLCDLYAKEHPDARWEPVGNVLGCIFTPDGSAGNDSFGVLPTPVQKWAGLKTTSGELESKTAWKVFDKVDEDIAVSRELTAANDEGATFRQIAAFIEKHWRRL